MSSWLKLIQQHRAIAVIRSSDFLIAHQMAMAVAAGGMRLIEITWNSDRPAELIQQLRSTLPDCVIGAGTLLNSAQMQAAIVAGAQFLFTPHTDRELIQIAVEQAIPIIPGALSPTEILQAWQAGATCVKVFPIQVLGGAEYLRCLRAPLGEIPLIPTGGVTIANAREFLEAGAVAVGLSGSLFPKQAVSTGNWQAIAQQAQRLIQEISDPQMP